MLRDHQVVTLEFLFQTAFNSAAGYVVTSNGDGTMTVSPFRACDQAPIDIVSLGAKLVPVAVLDGCSKVTTVPEQIACVRNAFVFDASKPACSVPGGHVGPP